VQSVLHVSFFAGCCLSLVFVREEEGGLSFFLWFVFYSYPKFFISFSYISIDQLDSRYLLLRLSYEF
jgi:hypothetical protein